VPIIGVTYGRFFVGSVPGSGTPAGVGVNLYQDSHWRFGAAISADVVSPRKESDDSHLQGLGDINRTARAGVFASYTYDQLSVRANVGSDILNKKQGTAVGLEVEATRRCGR
jgi:outer membrane protein